MLRTFSWLAAACAALCLTTASALGLGEIDVRSKLNQRLYAVIPLTSITGEDAEAAIIGLGSVDDFERYGIERTEFLSTLRFAVTTDGGNPRIVVTSQTSAFEPYLSFLVEVRTRTGRSLREYTVLLDPPDMPAPVAKPAPAKPVAAPAAAPGEFYETPEEAQRRLAGMNKPATITPTPKPAPAPAAESAPAMPPAAPAAPAAAAEMPAAGGSSYGPVAQKETLWSIATKLRPDPSISMDQVLLALYKANPRSFEGFNGLRKGSTLNVPSADDMRAVSASAAKARVAELRGMAPPEPKAPKAPRTPAVTPEVPVIPVPPPAAATPPPSNLPPIPGSKPKPAVVAPPVPVPPPAAVPKPAPVAPPPAVPVPKIDNKPLVPPPPVPKIDNKPLVPPPPAATGTKPAQPAVAVPPPPPPTAAAVPPPPTGLDQPLIPPPAPGDTAAVTPSTGDATAPVAAVPPPPKPAVRAPVVEEPPVEESSNAGLYLWIVVALILLGAGGFFGFRRWKAMQGGGGGGDGAEKKSFIPSAKLRKAAAVAGTSFDDAPPAAAPPPGRPAPAPSDDDFSQRLGDTGGADSFSSTDFDATMTSESPAAKFDSTSTLALSTGQNPGYSSTQAIDTTQSRTGAQTAQSPAAPSSDHVDFDVTSQFAAETMSINLDANDPVSEADFHLAYGLYDEAALLLKQAAEKDPGRTDVRVKLAETYFAASRPADFLQVAETLQHQLPEADWQKLAIMGQQLCPDAAIFAGAGDSLGSDIDLSFDDPATPAAAPAAHASEAHEIGGLDFKLEELELPKLEEPKLDMPAPAAAPKPAPKPAADAPLEFKLDAAPAKQMPSFGSTAIGFNANATSEVAQQKPAKLDFDADSLATVALNSNDGDADVRLDDFDLNEASTAISAGDESSTKLDLARAYADMGDNDMARTLLKEVVEQGNASQQKEAQALMGRLA